MSNSDSVKVDNHVWGDIYNGRKEALIASNLLRDGEFPSDGDNNKHSLRIIIHSNGIREVVNAKYKRLNNLENVIKVTRTGKRFNVWVRAAEEDQETRGLIHRMKFRGFNQTIKDEGFTKFMYMVFSTDWYRDEVKFNKASHY